MRALGVWPAADGPPGSGPDTSTVFGLPAEILRRIVEALAPSAIVALLVVFAASLCLIVAVATRHFGKGRTVVDDDTDTGELVPGLEHPAE